MKKLFVALWAVLTALYAGESGQFNLAGLLPGLGALTPKATVPARQGFRTDVQVTDGDVDYDTEAEVFGAIGAVGVWTTIWEMTIPAQQAVHWGYGSPATPQNQGYMWFCIADCVGAFVDFSVGVLRLVQQNARRTRTIVVCEIADAALHVAAGGIGIAANALLNKNEMYALPEKVEHPLVGEDSFIGLQYRLITAATAADSAGFKIPITVYQ